MITESWDDYYAMGRGDDWERGYAAGYDRALGHVLMMVEGQTGTNAFIRGVLIKLRKEILNDTPDAQR